MKKKSIIAIIAAVALTAALSIGGTLAYLSAVTETKTNTFSSSKDVKTVLDEKDFDPEEASNYYPGKVIAKNPTMTNSSDSETPIWVAVSLNFTNGASSMTRAAFEQYATINGFDTTDWQQIGTAPDGTELWMYKTALAKGATTNAIFTGVTVNAGITEVKKFGTEGKIIYTKDEAGNLIDVKDNTTVVNTTKYYDSQGNELTGVIASKVSSTLPTFEINVKGYAVQVDGVDSTAAATQLKGLADDALKTTFA